MLRSIFYIEVRRVGYSIQYGQTIAKKYCTKSTKKKKYLIYIFISVALVVMLFCFRESFYPGDREVTKAALGTMTENIKSGQSIADAFREFCGDIIAGAEPS